MATIDDERFRAISDAEANRTDEELKRLIRLYDKRMADIEEEIEDQARRLSVDNSISYSKAKELLSPPELKKFRWSIEEYAKRAEEIGSTGKWKSELNIESKKARVTRLEAAKFHIRAETERLYAEIDKTHETLAKDVYSEAYLKTGYFTQDELGSYSTFAKPDFERIKKTASKGWTSDGKNYSARVWENRQKVASVIETELTNAAIRGDSVEKTVKNLSGKIEQNVPKSYIERLVRTESTYMATAGQLDSYRELGADGVKFVATLDEVTCKTCGPLDGMVYLFDEAMPGKTVPPVHPNCRCTLAPWYDDSDEVVKEEWTRRARDPETGKSVDVPEMSFDDWKSVYVDRIKKLEDVAKMLLETVPKIRDYFNTNTSERGVDDSLDKYTDDNGNLIPERENLHRQIINDILKDAVREDTPTFFVMGGGPASGKSTLLNSGAVKLPKNIIKIDSDDIKTRLPEYTDMVSGGDKNAASFVHEESSALAKRIMKIANNEKFTYLLDGTGDGSVQSLTKKIESAKKSGMRVVGIYATVSIEEAIERATARASKTGRMVPVKTIVEIHMNVSKILPECAPLFDSVELYDTTTNTPVLIATGGNGETMNPVKGQEDLYKAFIRKTMYIKP